jgi:hypothetical protein
MAGLMLMVSNSLAKQNQFLEIKLRELANSYMPE